MTEIIDKNNAMIQDYMRLKRIEAKINRIVDSWHEERYDTDWDTLQSSLMKIYRMMHKK